MGEGKLYLGDLASINVEKPYLHEFDINVVVTCSNVSQSVKKENTEYHKFSLEDYETQIIDEEVFNETCEIIRTNLSNGKNVAVHCNAGVSRSASIVVNFLCSTLNIGL